MSDVNAKHVFVSNAFGCNRNLFLRVCESVFGGVGFGGGRGGGEGGGGR